MKHIFSIILATFIVFNLHGQNVEFNKELAAEYAKIAIKELAVHQSIAVEASNYNYNDVSFFSGESKDCEGELFNYVLVGFKGKKSGYAIVVLRYNKDGYISSIPSRSTTSNTPKQVHNAIQNSKPLQRFWDCDI